MASDPKYSFYTHFENLKNDLYRELSGARASKLLIPNYFYNWFYVSEKLQYNLYVKRQELGINISESEVNEYNQIRESFLPKSKYLLVRKSFNAGRGVTYDDVVLERPSFRNRVIGYLALGLFAHFGLGLSRYWIVGGLIPVALSKYADSKFSPKEEIESFYNFVAERRDADRLYNKSKEVIINLEDKKGISTIFRELKSTSKSFVEARDELNSAYLSAALKANIL